MGVPYGTGGLGAGGPADAAAVLEVTAPAVAEFRDRPPSANRPPAAAGTLPDLRLTLHGALNVDMLGAFVDPDGDALTYTVSSAARCRDGAGGGRPGDADGGGPGQGRARGEGDRRRRAERGTDFWNEPRQSGDLKACPGTISGAQSPQS